ncbi:hypothetical protein K8I85_19085 [bacterium]|nr:hypothetical protein [bacterium]
MRSRILTLPALALSLGLVTLPALAGVRAPADTDGIPCELWLRSTFELEPPPAGCQYRFNALGSLDDLSVILTLRDCFDAPITFCDVRFTVEPAPDTPHFCVCEPAAQVVTTDGDGVATCSFSRIGGSGVAGVRLTVLCGGNVDFPLVLPFTFTSPDQNGSCEPGVSTSIVDLALWAGGLSFYRLASDFNCDGQIGLLDLALWASGIGTGCP